MIADPNNVQTYWTGGNYDIMAASKTLNGGTSWTRYNLAAAGYTYSLAMDPTNSNTVYAGGDPGVYRTTNAGADWVDVSAGLTDIAMDIALDPINTAILYAATRDGVFKTTNSGGNWVNTGCSEVNCVLVDPNAPETIYVGSVSGVYKSSNSGGSWVAMNDGLDELQVTSLDIDPNNYLFAGTSGKSMYRWSLITGVDEQVNRTTVPHSFHISPNPLHDVFSLSYTLTSPTHVEISLYDVQGRLVSKLWDGMKTAGQHSINLSIKDIECRTPPGIYFCSMTTYESEVHCKMVILPN